MESNAHGRLVESNAGGRLVESNEEKSVGSASLIIDNIPPSLNNISSLNDFFSKFGIVINVQVGKQLRNIFLLSVSMW